jgi:hypothetical protein
MNNHKNDMETQRENISFVFSSETFNYKILRLTEKLERHLAARGGRRAIISRVGLTLWEQPA